MLALVALIALLHTAACATEVLEAAEITFTLNLVLVSASARATHLRPRDEDAVLDGLLATLATLRDATTVVYDVWTDNSEVGGAHVSVLVTAALREGGPGPEAVVAACADEVEQVLAGPGGSERFGRAIVSSGYAQGTATLLDVSVSEHYDITRRRRRPEQQPGPAPGGPPRPLSAVDSATFAERILSASPPEEVVLATRANCACFSQGMLDALEEYCPEVAAAVGLGCNFGSTDRAQLELWAVDCPGLQGDFGPFFLGEE